MAAIASILRQCGTELQKRFGPDALAIFENVLDQAAAEIGAEEKPPASETPAAHSASRLADQFAETDRI
jgi:hypothetical protein